VQGLPEIVSHYANQRCLKLPRGWSFRVPILPIRPDGQAFDRSHPVPLLAYDDPVPSKAGRKGIAILRFGAVDQLIV
jgi:hypothetical protein